MCQKRDRKVVFREERGVTSIKKAGVSSGLNFLVLSGQPLRSHFLVAVDYFADNTESIFATNQGYRCFLMVN